MTEISGVSAVFISVTDLFRLPQRLDLPVLQPDNPVAHIADLLQAVGHEQNRRTAAHQLQHPPAALFLKRGVAHRQDLVHDQDLRVHHRRDGKRQPRQHSGGVVPDRHLDELSQFGKLYNFIVFGLQKLLAVPQNGAVEEDILVPRQVHVKAGAKLQHGHDVSPARHAALRGLQNAGDHLQNRALARAVVPDDAHDLALVHVKAGVPERPELVGLQPAAELAGHKLF